ncbi:DEAD/DEAH box helicase [Flavobacterium johnsoniae]|uniref:Helicase conserved C-terminal domain-containing protein n=1 Tax=Flavobacterium johnsoniae TaxID=986 RepID=A0A1M5V5X0_FLAJO|nr:DEAD/DEAH box helicase [Flavobacterium johnsoniae]SHH70642.1 Helicase conserved C-terminal domain-containing protein [Flavobacterium johnsoniae]
MSIQTKYNYLEQAYPDVLKGIGMLIQKAKLSRRFDSIQLSEEEIDQLQKAKEICELKIVELWENREHPEFKGLCSTYFDIASQLSIQLDSELFVYEQLKLIAFGYLGEHWHFVKQYFKSHSSQFEAIQMGENWNQRILTISFKAIVHLIRKENWQEIDESVALINQLRQEQNDFENTFLNQVDEESRPYGAAELVSLYHFAKCVDVLGNYMMEGRPLEPENELQYHTGIALEYAQKSGNLSLGLLYQFFEAFAVKMVRNTIWYTTRGINNWVTRFNQFVAHREEKGLFELLYPQRESIIEGELLNPAHRAVVVNLPTSSGKTLIAEYRILQALNQFKERGGWVAYVVPTKALVNQIYIQLKKDLSSIGIRIEKASGAIDLDGFEQYLVEENGNHTNFDILITTYEKMNLLVRQGLGTTTDRPLVLTVVDEAHNIEEKQRGLNLEFLLSTIKNDCEEANFLLMTPDISNSLDLSRWLAGDRGNVINLELDWWQPNERIVGAIEIEGRARNYEYTLRTLHTDKGTYDIGCTIPLSSIENSDHTASQARDSKVKMASQVASDVISLESPIIVLASNPNETYKIAENLYENVGNDIETDEDVDLVIKLVQSELGENFPLVKYLKRRIAVHSSALPDEIRFLIEDLMSNEKLQVLVATTTIAQGINFPVSAVIMGAYNYPYSGAMPVRDFWNLAGRVGRAGQDSMGWVGIAVRNEADLLEVGNYVRKASDNLHSQLVNAIDNALRHAEEDFDRWLFVDDRWSAILQYISHLRRQTQQQETFLAQLELKLQATFGYNQLSGEKKNFLRDNLRRYVSTLTLADAKRADETGFSSVSVRQMIGRLASSNISPQDWQKNQLFSENNQTMQNLVGIMLNTYEIKKSINDINEGGLPLDRSSIARLIIDWVNGRNLASIASRMYPDIENTIAIQKATRALYKIVANSATWGLSALQKMPTSGVDWENMSDIEKKKMANLPAYLHYGVNTDEGVLMRKNNVPRSVANRLGELYNASVNGEIFNQPSDAVNNWISQQTTQTWTNVKPVDSKLSGEDYKRIWKKLNGV